uniref:MHC class II antigen n=1 Tax=Dipodomys spectabilis TaxID=105255 RepID=B6SDD1_DIPSP|nr:MHC class II antigen [Dipodomys spectabilis]
MVCLWLPSSPFKATLTLMLMALSPPVALFRDTRPRFMQQLKGECYFPNGTEGVWSVIRHIYNQKGFLRFDSDVGEFRAQTELGRLIAEELNSQKDVLDNYRASVDRCRNNYPLVDLLLSLQGVMPKVTVYPTKTEPLQHHNLLVCAVHGFYPGNIEVRWLRNGQEEKAGVVSTGLVYNGDWTFQIMVMLEMTPQQGDVYTCHVEHPSLDGPVTVEWKPQSGSAQGKMMSGVGGFVLGLLFLGAGLFIYHRNSKGHSGLQPAGLLS